MTAKQIWILTLAAAFFIPLCLGVQTSLSVGTRRGYPGTTVAVPVVLREGANVTAMQADVSFDAGRVTSLAPESSLRLTNHVVRTREVAPGVRRVLVYSLSNAVLPARSNAVGLVSLPFAVSANERVSSGPISPVSAVLAQPDGSAVSPVSGQAGEIVIASVNLRADGTVDFFLPAQPGSNYVAQASTNLVDWTNLSTNLATGAWLDLMDADAVNFSQRFYRVVPWP